MIDETEYLPSTCSSLKIHQQNVVYKSNFLVILKFYIIINKSPCGMGLDNTVEWQPMVVDAIESWGGITLPTLSDSPKEGKFCNRISLRLSYVYMYAWPLCHLFIFLH